MVLRQNVKKASLVYIYNLLNYEVEISSLTPKNGSSVKVMGLINM